MLRLPRFMPALTIACSMAVPVLYGSPLLAQDTPPANNADQSTPVDAALRTDVDNYWHYGKIARYDLAVAEGQKIIARKDQPQAVLAAFEAVSAAHQDNLDQWLLRWQGVDAMRDVTTQVINVLAEGYRQRRADLTYIEQNIQRLSVNQRAYALALGRLRESGELAVPLMVDYLRDSSKREYQPAIRRALRDFGRLALNPLTAATYMKDDQTLTTIVAILGDIGYDSAVPYLARLANGQDVPEGVRSAAAQALIQMGAGEPAKLSAPQLFYNLAEKFYYNTSTITADSRNPSAFVWYWDDQKGLYKKDVPPQIFNDIMAMRSSEESLRLDASNKPAVSLWLASDYKREADLPAGAADPTRGENAPSAHYYGVAAGTGYLGDVLSRAMKDRNSAVALRSLKSLEEIAGASNLLGEGGSPVIDALEYPDRLVRFEAAFTVASALPQQGFNGQNRVVPILAEAVSQTGRPQVLLVLSSQDELNKYTDALKADFGVAGATGAQAAVNEANALPSVDVVVVSEDIGGQIDQLRALMGQNQKLQSAPLVVITKTGASPFVSMAATNKMIVVTQATDAAGLKPVITEARGRSMSLPMDEALATAYAKRAAELLGQLAISRGQILDISVAQPTLLASLNDSRADLVKSVADVLALIHSKEAQVGLLTKASDEKTANDVKVACYKSLATNAKFFGNQLDETHIAALQKVVQSAADLTVRSAAAEARGALNLPADQAAELILSQANGG